MCWAKKLANQFQQYDSYKGDWTHQLEGKHWVITWHETTWSNASGLQEQNTQSYLWWNKCEVGQLKKTEFLLTSFKKTSD